MQLSVFVNNIENIIISNGESVGPETIKLIDWYKTQQNEGIKEVFIDVNRSAEEWNLLSISNRAENIARSLNELNDQIALGNSRSITTDTDLQNCNSTSELSQSTIDAILNCRL